MASDAVDHVMRGESNDPWIDSCPQYLDLRVRD
jgi:hypothetical protein